MTDQFARVVALVDAFLEGGRYWTLWSPICGPEFDELPVDALSPSEVKAQFELVELVHVGQPGSASSSDRRDGLLGEDELRDRLRQWRRQFVQAPSA